MIKSIMHALNGLKMGLFHERNISIITLAAILTIGLSIYLDLSKTELSIIILISVVVVCLELINLALEKFIDLVSPEKHEIIKFTKDILAASTLIGSIGAIAIAALIILPKVLDINIFNNIL